MNKLLCICIIILSCIIWKILDVFIKIFLEKVTYEDTNKRKRRRKRKEDDIMKENNIKRFAIMLAIICVSLCYFVKNGYNFWVSIEENDFQIELYNPSHR